MAKAAGAGQAVGPVPLPQPGRGPGAGKARPRLAFLPSVGHTWNQIPSALGSTPTGLPGGLTPAQLVPAPGPLHLLPGPPGTLGHGSSHGEHLSVTEFSCHKVTSSGRSGWPLPLPLYGSSVPAPHWPCFSWGGKKPGASGRRAISLGGKEADYQADSRFSSFKPTAFWEARCRKPGGQAPPQAQGEQGRLPGRSNAEGRTENETLSGEESEGRRARQRDEVER